MSEEIILPFDVYKHKDRDFTWEMDSLEIEDKISELRKQIKQLQNCRKKQPKLAIFRKINHGTGKMQCHIFHGFQIIDENKNMFCADNWRPITEKEAELLKKKYNLKEEAIKTIENTIKNNKRSTR